MSRRRNSSNNNPSNNNQPSNNRHRPKRRLRKLKLLKQRKHLPKIQIPNRWTAFPLQTIGACQTNPCCIADVRYGRSTDLPNVRFRGVKRTELDYPPWQAARQFAQDRFQSFPPLNVLWSGGRLPEGTTPKQGIIQKTY
jgi:hypothetical protein